MKPSLPLVGVGVAFVLAGCMTVPTAPSIPYEPTTFRSSVPMPALPPEPSIEQATVPRESLVGVRYVPTKARAATAGDIEVVVEPATLGAIRTAGFKGEHLLIQPTGLIAWIVVRNKSDHIVDLGHSILQFEDDKGREYAIEEGGWAGSTIAFIDLLCNQYAREASVLTDQYRSSLEGLLRDVRARTAAAQRANDDALNLHSQSIQGGYGPLFERYITEVDTYNRRNYIGSTPTRQGVQKLYLQKPYVIGIDATDRPERLIDVKRQARAQANRQLEEAVQSFQAETRARTDALKARLLSEIEERRAEWKRAVQALPIEATKVVRGNGQFDPVVIPPAKHRTVFVPGIRNIEGRDRGTPELPPILILKLYDLPARTDQAARVTQRSSLEFRLQRQPVHVFIKDE